MNKSVQSLGLVAVVLIAFAANSLLCRWALLVFHYDPIVFTVLRLFSGAVTLVGLLYWLPSKPRLRLLPFSSRRFWLLGASLLLYALMFSLAYVQLDTGVGAFILFVAVQLMLLLVARFTGQRLNKQQVLGALIAIAGLALLLLPNADGTYIGYAGLMLLAAMGWAMFVLLGKGSVAPLVDVSSAFVAATLLMFGLVFILSISMGQAFDVDWFSSAFFLAIISGAITSGVGYYLWYRVLPLIGVQKAAQLQLLVPVIATVMGSLVLGEVLTFIAVIASAVIVFGVWLFLVAAVEK